jgi:hypothetical protein
MGKLCVRCLAVESARRSARLPGRVAPAGPWDRDFLATIHQIPIHRFLKNLTINRSDISSGHQLRLSEEQLKPMALPAHSALED